MATPNPTIMQAVEQLGYRVTVGDVATQAGLELQLAEQGLLALATEVGGNLQVAESGEVAYVFPKNLQAILRSKSAQLRWQERWQKIWRILFYLIRISFGIALILSIVLIFVAITIIVISLNSSRDGDSNDSSGGDNTPIFMPTFWWGPDIFWVFYPDYDDYRSPRRRQLERGDRQMNFLEAVFSFLFGDGNPNANLEERRWRAIAAVIRNHSGAVVAEQITPYLDSLGTGFDREYEQFMIPVLSRFNGRPEVSPQGELVYHFPELQVAAQDRKRQIVPEFLEEYRFKFSAASSGQLILAASLGVLNFVGAIVLGTLLADGAIAAELGGLVAFVQSIYWLLLGYGSLFLAVPVIRHLWNQGRNRKIEQRNAKRQNQAFLLAKVETRLQQKIDYAQQFAAQTIIDANNLAYTTETDLLEQEVNQSEQLDAEWQRRLEGR